MIRIVSAFAIVLCAATASAQQWADKMFTLHSHDFGPVPRAAKVEYVFPLKNLYAEDVHISHVGASCSCIEPRIVKDTLKAHETGGIVAALNTHAFSGQRNVRLTVTIDKPQFAQVELQVRGYIRTDVVLNPGQVNFGSTNEGQTADKTIRIEHAGRSDWKINDVKTNLPYLTADFKEVSRDYDRVAYDLTVHLKEGAPVGYLNDRLIVATNDHRTKQFSVDVEGRLVAELSVSPATLMLGTLESGQTVTKQIVVKGAKPFTITAVNCDNDAFSFTVPTDAKAVHLIPVKFTAGNTSTRISQTIEIVTDLGGGRSVKLTALGEIGAPLAGK